MVPDVKVCRMCEKELPITEFYRSRSTGRLYTRCKKCHGKHTRAVESPEVVRESHRRSRMRLKMRVFLHYGGSIPRCVCCGNSYLNHLAIDHIDGIGHLQRRIDGVPTGHAMYSFLEKAGYPPGFQVLCHNCNMAKHMEGGRCHCHDDYLSVEDDDEDEEDMLYDIKEGPVS